MQIGDLGSQMDQFAAERYAQKLSIRYVSGPRNQVLGRAKRGPSSLVSRVHRPSGASSPACQIVDDRVIR